MNKVKKLNQKINQIDEIIEKEAATLALYIRIRNDIYEELKEVKNAYEQQLGKIEEIKKQRVVLEYIELNKIYNELKEKQASYEMCINKNSKHPKLSLVIEESEKTAKELSVYKDRIRQIKLNEKIGNFEYAVMKLNAIKKEKQRLEEYLDKALKISFEKGKEFEKLMEKKHALQTKLKKKQESQREF